MAEEPIVRRRIRVEGRVQGVGFRYFASSIARNLGLKGFVRNEPDGAVVCEAQGPRALVEQLVAQVRRGPAHARVLRCEVAELEPRDDATDFAIDR
jgi:acylphosphatase